MSGTIAEKILAKASRKKYVEPGDFIVADVDVVFAHDGTATLAFDVMKELNEEKVFDSKKVVLFIDHAAPSPSPAISAIHNRMRDFSKLHNVKLYDVGNGICHQLLPSEGYVKPGSLVIGADSHTVTHGAFNAFATGVGSTDAAIAMMTGKIWLKVPESIKLELNGNLSEGVTSKDLVLFLIGNFKADGFNYVAIEYSGSTIEKLSVDSRMTIANMGVEMGAKASLMPLNENTRVWLSKRVQGPITPVEPDKDATYYKTYSFDVKSIEPMVAAPPNVDNVKPVTELEGLEIDQVFIGSCTNGRLEDIELALRILKGRKVKSRCIVIPASKEVYYEALKKGYIEELLRSNCVVGPPTCGPCIGAHMGLLGPNEVGISTTNRNFPGRMGDRDAKIFLASPLTA
ncbi:MAG: 3-isopropylmalate dehydratase large subunit, partial [Thermoproteota archaeon]